jgi:phage terminase large subunit-like protein
VSVKHVSGGTSALQFKSFERGREKWQGAACEVIWFDEEYPADIYSEALTRTMRPAASSSSRSRLSMA